MAVPLEFIVPGVPASQQATAKGRGEWTSTVREVASEVWDGDQMLAEEVMVAITYFHRGDPPGRSPIDVDNIPKPILDAMNQVVYTDDGQVTDLLCRKRNLNDNLTFEDLSETLSEGISEHDYFVQVLVEEARTQEV